MSKHDIGDTIRVSDRMQRNYAYRLDAPPGEDFDEGFNPYYTPVEMLRMGVFEGKYLNDCRGEFPREWFIGARVVKTGAPADESLNYFGIKSRQPLTVWRDKGWVIGHDPRGWFQWYCRYYLGRRDAAVDAKQIQRWKNFTRHAGQIRANCQPGDLECRPRQRQALLQWSHEATI